jgi:hypothetical protein
MSAKNSSVISHKTVDNSRISYDLSRLDTTSICQTIQINAIYSYSVYEPKLLFKDSGINFPARGKIEVIPLSSKENA